MSAKRRAKIDRLMPAMAARLSTVWTADGRSMTLATAHASRRSPSKAKNGEATSSSVRWRRSKRMRHCFIIASVRAWVPMPGCAVSSSMAAKRLRIAALCDTSSTTGLRKLSNRPSAPP